MMGYRIPKGTLVYPATLKIAVVDGRQQWNVNHTGTPVPSVEDWYFTNAEWFTGNPDDRVNIRLNNSVYIVVVLAEIDQSIHKHNAFLAPFFAVKEVMMF